MNTKAKQHKHYFAKRTTEQSLNATSVMHRVGFESVILAVDCVMSCVQRVEVCTINVYCYVLYSDTLQHKKFDVLVFI